MDLVAYVDEMANALGVDERVRTRYRKFTHFSSSQMRLLFASSCGGESCTRIFDHYARAYESDAYKLWITPSDKLVTDTGSWWECVPGARGRAVASSLPSGVQMFQCLSRLDRLANLVRTSVFQSPPRQFGTRIRALET
jgi:hypothetical protein